MTVIAAKEEVERQNEDLRSVIGDREAQNSALNSEINEVQN